MTPEFGIALFASIVAALGVLVGGVFQYVTYKEMHRSRSERDRPYLVALLETHPSPVLRVENVGSRPASRVTVESPDWLLDSNDRKLTDNPHLTDGFPLIPAG